MTVALTADAPYAPLPTAETIQTVLLGGDLSKLTPDQRIAYYRKVCDSLGLNPFTRPFEYMRLSGKEQLYPKKECTDQLRRNYGVSLGTPRGELVDGIYSVWVDAKLPDGRSDTDMGAVDLGASKGEIRCNLMLKAVTKAKRRVTLSICGLGMLDETEAETIPEATLDVHPEERGAAPRPADTVIIEKVDVFEKGAAVTLSTGEIVYAKPALVADLQTLQQSRERVAYDAAPARDDKIELVRVIRISEIPF